VAEDGKQKRSNPFGSALWKIGERRIEMDVQKIKRDGEKEALRDAIRIRLFKIRASTENASMSYFNNIVRELNQIDYLVSEIRELVSELEEA
jgi:hypothetical protein